MTRLEQLTRLNNQLLDDMPWLRKQAEAFSRTEVAQWELFRSLVNVRRPCPISDDFRKLQSDFLKKEIKNKGITDLKDLVSVRDDLYLWRGDITTLSVDAIVNAANSGLTGCYSPLHGCVDNAIHTFAGVELRLECAKIMERQKASEPTGRAKITKAYNLPSRHVIHTVGPIVSGELTHTHCEQLACCYRSSLDLADRQALNSIAFCCISTGEFHFPNQVAAQIAIETVEDYKNKTGSSLAVVFTVFKEEDDLIYQRLLRQPSARG
ncbi:MAG: protein-ADP-ribose hydrolase [Fastidiosipilaceae bacterium]|jgi:O-acetyl-ADP-ribose deacetylase (regulator of RNase III)